MTHNEKELLLKDLCARLPYMVKVKTLLKEPYTLKGLSDTEYGGVMGHLLGKFVPNNVSPKTVNYPLSQFKPYLFPLSSMTEEQKRELEQIKNDEDAPYYHDINDFFLKYHLDNRHLIEKGLALDATGLNIY